MNKLLKVTLITAIMATSGMCGGNDGNKPEFQHQYPQQLANTQYVPNCLPCIALTGGALAIGGVLIYTCFNGSCQDCCKANPKSIQLNSDQAKFLFGSASYNINATDFKASTSDDSKYEIKLGNTIAGYGSPSFNKNDKIGVAEVSQEISSADIVNFSNEITYYQFVVSSTNSNVLTITAKCKDDDAKKLLSSSGSTKFYLISPFADVISASKGAVAD